MTCLEISNSIHSDRLAVTERRRKQIVRDYQIHSMKNILTAFILLLNVPSSYTFAQPGDPNLEYRLRWFNIAQDSVIDNPDNLYHRWARLDILFTPYFSVQTKPTENLKEYLSNSSQFYAYVADTLLENYQPCDMCRFEKRKKYNPASKLGSFLLYNQDQLISDLTNLINSDKTFHAQTLNNIVLYVENPDKSDFLYKRGQFYYLTGRADKGLNDFLAALNHSPNEELKKRIYTTLAAYYCTIENSDLQENYKLALNYIQLAEPAIEDSSYCKGEVPHDYIYEIEKLHLMKKNLDSTSFVNYLQNRSASYLNYYYSLMETGDGKDEQYYTSDRAFQRSREYELMIYNYLIELDSRTGAAELKKHKKLIIEKI